MTKQLTIGRVKPTTRPAPGRFCLSTRILLIVAALFALSLGPDVVAQGVTAYIGGGLGVASTKFDADQIHFDADDLSPSETSWRLFGGTRFHPNLGMEVGYVSIDEARITENVYDDFFEVQVTGVDVSGLLILPLVPALSVYGRAGLVFWSSDLNYRFTDIGGGTASESGSNLVLGAGAQLALSRSLGVRGEYTRYELDEADAGVGGIDMLSGSVLISFGGSSD